MIAKRLRSEYPGEFVITATYLLNGIKTQQREWIDNPIKNQHISGRAAVIMSESDRHRFDYARLQRHRGGLRGTKRLQTYGIGPTWQDLDLNFYVSLDPDVLRDISTVNYGDDTVVYTDRKRILQFAGEFFLIPHCPFMLEPALALYLACFDGHREIFVLGHQIPDQRYHARWIGQVRDVMTAYRDCQFYFVTNTETNVPAAWRLSNSDWMPVRKFISFCDI